MASAQLIGPLPEVTLSSGCTVTFEAIDPNSGATVTGVTVSQAALWGVNLTEDAAVPPAEALPPLYVSIPDEPFYG